MLTVVKRSRLTPVRKEATGERNLLAWLGDDRMLSRSLGWIFVLGPLSALVGLLFPQPRYAIPALIVAASIVGLVVGIGLLAGAFDRMPEAVYPALVYVATALITVVVYAAGRPIGGARSYYLWAIPYAFAFFSRRQVIGQLAFMTACSFGALALFVASHPTAESLGSYLGVWFVSVMTVLVVGGLVRRLTQSLRHAELRFRRKFDSAPVGFAFVSLEREFLDVNDAFCRMTGRRRDELVGTRTSDLWHPDDDTQIVQRLRECAQTNAVDFDARVIRPDGTVRSVSVSTTFITPGHGKPYHYALVRDITEQLRDREMLAHQAIHDSLTGLYNRTLLVDRLEAALERGRGGVAVVLVDLDRFKVINDSLGHHIGDQILTALASRFASAIAIGDTLARFGGDEFAVLCEDVRDPMDALARATRIMRSLEEPITLTSGSHVICASLGVAVADQPRASASRLLADADAALHRAKVRGRARVEMFDESLRSEVKERLALERELRVALDKGQFFVEYQPTVDTDTGYPTGLEALVRWRHPSLGVVSPADFVPVAEDTGLIDKLGEWVLQTATADLAVWQAALPTEPPLRVAVNVSGRQLASDGFVDTVACALRRSGIGPGTLGLEITESLLLNTDEELLARLHRLKELRTRLLLDDFGTGYSSLAYLKRFPIDVLKIDRSFIDGLGTEDEDTAIVEAIIRMAGALNLEVVAEGLESERQLGELRRLGCHRVQGFIVSPPLARERVEEFLREQMAVSAASEASAFGARA